MTTWGYSASSSARSLPASPAIYLLMSLRAQLALVSGKTSTLLAKSLESKRRKARDTGSISWNTHTGCNETHDINSSSSNDMLQMCLGVPNRAGMSQIERSDSLGNRALNSRSHRILLLKLLGCLPATSL